MKTIIRMAGLVVCLVLASGVGWTQTDPRLEAVQQLVDSIQKIEGSVFAPATWNRAEKKLTEAQTAVSTQRSDKAVNALAAECETRMQDVLKAAEVAKLALEQYLPPRAKAREAKAPELAPALYKQAEAQFMAATGKVDDGDVKGGLREADKSLPLFDKAELEAIKSDIMGKADTLIRKAVEGGSDKFALATLDRARTAREKCDAILTKDRYERSESLAEIKRAEYEARHAVEIAQSVRSLERNDQAWEKLILIYEMQMNRAGEALALPLVPFNAGPGPAGDTLVAAINGLKGRGQSSSDYQSHITERLQEVAGKLGMESAPADPDVLITGIETRLGELRAERDRLAENLNQKSAQMDQLEQSQGQVTAELEARTEQDKKIARAKEIIAPAEGEVIFTATGDMVLRLIGIAFDVSKSEIKNEHIALLQKVRDIIDLFPQAKILVEGHTDGVGDAGSNLRLSEKRATAVMQYLRQIGGYSAERINAVGYGAERPVASNDSQEGRAKNRRIDVVIMH